MKSVVFTLILTLLTAPAAFAGNDGIMGAVGDFAYETSAKGALTNRNATTAMYTDALNTESKAWSTFPPNIRMLAKSFQMGRDGSKLNAQSEEYAKASLHAIQTAKQSGNFDPSRFNIVDEAKLKEWATVQNPIVKTAKDRFSRYEKYGIKLGNDKSTLTTPVGSLNLRGDITTGMLTTIASALGYDPADVTAGLQDGIDARNRILGEVTAATEAEIAQKLAEAKANGSLPEGTAPDRETASLADSSKNGAGSGDEGSGSKPTSHAGDDKGMLPQTAGGPDTESEDANLRQKELEANLEAIRKTMGAEGFKDPIGRPAQNIFTMVHDRYQTVRERGRLMEQESPPTAN